MTKTVLSILLCTFATTAQTFASGATGAGTFNGGSCHCLTPAGSNGSYAFNFTVTAASGCKPAKGTISLTDTACSFGTINGKITKVEAFDIAQATFTVYGVVSFGPLKKQAFMLKLSGGLLTFTQVSGLCNSDCQGFFANATVPAGSITLVP